MARALMLNEPVRNNRHGEPEPQVRSRARVGAKPTITDEMRAMAEQSYVLNKEGNAKLREAEKLRTKLNVMMEQAGVANFDVFVDNKPVEAVIEGGTKNVVDNKKLLKHITTETFTEVAEVSQKAIKDNFGENMLMKVLSEVPVDPKLKIRDKKEG